MEMIMRMFVSLLCIIVAFIGIILAVFNIYVPNIRVVAIIAFAAFAAAHSNRMMWEEQ